MIRNNKGKRFFSILIATSLVSALFIKEQPVLAKDRIENETEIFRVDETLKELPGIPIMDEEGNITYIDEEESPIAEQTISLFSGERSRTVEVVNFRYNAKGEEIPTGTTTSYTVEGVLDDRGRPLSGYTYGRYGADAAYLGMKDGKVRFMQSGVIGLVDASAVYIDTAVVDNLSHYEVKNGKLIHYISSNIRTQNGSRLVMGDAADYMAEGDVYYSYDGIYFYKEFSKMIEDYKKDERRQSVNLSKPYYNYYQYLPLRSKTAYTAEELNEIINQKITPSSKLYNLGEKAVQLQNTYGVNALLVLSVGANESDWGRSGIAQRKNNLFGLQAFDKNPDDAFVFSSPEKCVEEYMSIHMSKQYLNPLNWKYYGGFLGNKGSGINLKYASDPYWGEKAANIARNLDREKRDEGRYTLGIKDTLNSHHTSLNIRTDNSTSSTSVYTTRKCSNTSFIIRGEKEGWYQVQSDPVLTGDRKSIDQSTGVYNFDNMYLYAHKDYIQVAYKGKDSNNPGTNGNTNLTSSRYKINSGDKTITGINDFPVSVSDFSKNLKVTNGNIKILSSSGDVKSGNIGTGDQVQLIDNSGKVVSTYNAVIYGDTNGDGIIDIFDLSQIQRDIIQATQIKGIKRTAGDTNRDGVIDIFDLSQVQRDIIGAAKVKQ